MVVTEARDRTCYFCEKLVTEDEFCYGCNAHICDDCEEVFPMGHHNPTEHKVE